MLHALGVGSYWRALGIMPNAPEFTRAVLAELDRFASGDQTLAEARGEIERRQKVVPLPVRPS